MLIAADKPIVRCTSFMWGWDQWCIAKNGSGYTQRGVAKGLKVPCLFMITEVSIRCPKNPGGWYTAYTPQYTTVCYPVWIPGVKKLKPLLHYITGRKPFFLLIYRRGVAVVGVALVVIVVFLVVVFFLCCCLCFFYITLQENLTFADFICLVSTLFHGIRFYWYQNLRRT